MPRSRYRQTFRTFRFLYKDVAGSGIPVNGYPPSQMKVDPEKDCTMRPSLVWSSLIFLMIYRIYKYQPGPSPQRGCTNGGRVANLKVRQ